MPNYIAALNGCLKIRFVVEDLVGLKEHTDSPWGAVTIVHLEIILLAELLWKVTGGQLDLVTLEELESILYHIFNVLNFIFFLDLHVFILLFQSANNHVEDSKSALSGPGLNICAVIPKQEGIPVSFLNQAQHYLPDFGLKIALDLFLEMKEAV